MDRLLFVAAVFIGEPLTQVLPPEPQGEKLSAQKVQLLSECRLSSQCEPILLTLLLLTNLTQLKIAHKPCTFDVLCYHSSCENRSEAHRNILSSLNDNSLYTKTFEE